MAAKYILAILGCAFLLAAVVRVGRDRNFQHPQSRTWLMIGVIFCAVAAWLFTRG